MDKFAAKIVIVTGAASGIGAGLCREMARRGSIVFAADVNEENAARVAASINGTGGKAIAKAVDVRREEDVRSLIEAAISEYGRLDYFFNNAGIAIGGDSRDITLDQWKKVIDVNLFGELHGSILAYAVMTKQGFGHIVNTASITGLLPQPGNAPYSTSKFGIVGLTLALRYEGAELGVKASIICPGRVQSGMFKSSIVMNINPEYDKILDHNFENAMEVSKAARIILNGVAKNKAIIAFPFVIRLVWFLNRLFPRLLEPLWIGEVRNLRKYRSTQA